MIKKVDTDGSGEIDFEEFLQMMQNMMEEGQTEEGMIEAFKVFDRDMGGDITSSELRECMTQLGNKMSHQ